jgi:hypothetical protein
VATIVGVVGDAHAIRLGSVRSSELYRPLLETDYPQAVLIVRAQGDPAALLPVMREAAAIDSRVIPGTGLLRDAFEQRVRSARLVSGIAAATGVLTLLIACLGIFGVVSYGATQRTKEFGIHIALGAERTAIVRLVTRHVLWPVTAGLALGIAAAGPLGMALTGGPLQLNASDPAAYAAALIVFVSSGLAAAFLPALRVLRSDPVQALRHS